jgi:hypothetical protein
MAWMMMRRGTAERMTRVRAQERRKARMRQVRVVVRCWMRRPEAREEAWRTSSVSLQFQLATNNNKRKEEMERTW